MPPPTNAHNAPYHPVLIKLPRAMLLPHELAAKVFELLSPHLQDAVELDWNGTMKRMPMKDQTVALSLQAVPPAMLAELELNSEN